jgi:hypothetical protein
VGTNPLTKTFSQACAGRVGRHPRATLFILLGLGVFISLTRWHTYHEPLERDLTTYAVIAHEIVHGRDLYQDLWDHKPPAIHATYAMAELVAGFGPGSVYLLGVAAAILALLGVYVAGCNGAGTRSAGLWAAAFWALSCGDLALQANQPNTEAFINACVVWGFALWLRPWPRRRLGWAVTIGLLFGLGTLYKQVVAVIPASIGAVHVMARPGEQHSRTRALGDVTVIGSVIVLSWTCVALYFASAGHLAAFYEQVVLYNREYAGNLLSNLLESLRLSLLQPALMRFTLPLWVVALLGALLSATRGLAQPWRMWLALSLGTQVAVALPGYFYPHYYQLWLPVATVGAGWPIAGGTVGYTERFSWLPATVGVLLCASLLLHQLPNYWASPEEWSQRKYGSPLFVVSKRLGRDIDRLLEPDERFYEWGNETGLYFYSGSLAADGRVLRLSVDPRTVRRKAVRTRRVRPPPPPAGGLHR